VEPGDFIHELSGNILCSTEEDQRDRIAGRFRVYYANFELAENHGVTAFEVLDAYQHTFDYAETVLDSDERPFSTRLYKLLANEIWNFNFLILDRVELLPKYRGNGVGLLILSCLIERFGSGAGVVGLKPFPLQFEPRHETESWNSRLKLETYSTDVQKSTRKLRRYYEKLGFVPMKSTPFMFRSLSWALPTSLELKSQDG